MGVCNCSMFYCTLLYVHSSIAIILMGKRELVALLNLSFWCLVMVERLILAVPQGCLRFVIVVFPDHTHLLFFYPTFKLMMDCYIIFFFQENEWQMRLIRLRAGMDRLVFTVVVYMHESQVFARSVRNDNCFYVVFHKGFLQMSCNI